MAARNDGKGRSGRRGGRASGLRGAHPVTPDGAPQSGGGRSASGAVPRPGRRGAHATRRNRPRLHMPRLGIPGLSRVGALLIAAALVAGLSLLATGPWLRVDQVAWSGTRFVAGVDLARVLEPLKGSNLLALDGAALAQRLEALPGVAAAHVEPTLSGDLDVAIDEQAPAIIWQTSRLRLLAGSDGRIFGALSLAGPLPKALASLPLVDDQRMVAAFLDPGKVIDPDERATALDLARLDPRSMGSSAKGLRVEIRDGCGYVLIPTGRASWQVALGYLGAAAESGTTPPTIDAQVAAVRTLFAAHPERDVRWIDVRNPGKVYWRANGPGGSDTC